MSDKGKWKKPRIAICIAVAGNVNAGVLLYRISFWDQREKVYRDGQWWIVNSIERYVFDSGLSLEQVKDALRNLRRSGILVTERHLFQSRIHAFVRISDKGQMALMETGQMAPIEASQTPTMETGQMAPIIKNGVLEESSGMDLNELSLVGASPEPGSVSEKEGHMKGLKSVMDVEQAVKAQKILHKPNSTKALEFIWKKRVAEITKAPVVFKKLDFHKLTQFIKQCPPGRAGAILTVVLDDWIMFVKKCESLAGEKNTPLIPRVDFLLRNVQVAVILATPKEHPPMKHEAPIGVASAKPVQVTSQPPEPKPEIVTSLKDIWADVEDDEDHK